MIEKPTVILDDRDAQQIFAQIIARRLGYVPEWLAPEGSAGAALARIASRYSSAVIQRLNQAPDKNKLAFLDLVGLGLVPARSARAPVVFQLSEKASSGSVPAETAVAAPPPVGSTDQIVFETERATGLMAGRLRQVFSVWPGRDEYIDHSAAMLAGETFQPFLRKSLQPTPHVIYLSHATLLALTGNVDLNVEFELSQPSSEPLEILWEYWDGEIWRAFLEAVTGCTPVQRALRDGTSGLTRSGSVRLKAEGVKASQTTVGAYKGFWIRGRLTETLPADPDNLLPDAETVRLGSNVSQPLTATLIVSKPQIERGPAVLSGFVRNEAGEPLAGARVIAILPDDPTQQFVTETLDDGSYRLDAAPLGKAYRFEVLFQDIDAAETSRDRISRTRPCIDLTFVVDGVKPDKAFADGVALDLTKPFYPLGLQPQPGATFYFSSQEIFGKPGAHVRVWMARARSPQDEASVVTSTQEIEASVVVTEQDSVLDHLLVWEYWNGTQWVAFDQSQSDPVARDLNVTEIVDLIVPTDFAPTKVNDQEGLWMRVRLMSGTFGVRHVVRWAADRLNNDFTYVITQPPALATFRMGYDWQFGLFHPERVLTYNDFRYEDRTDEARWPGRTFAPFERVGDLTPALYLGFDKKPPVDLLGLYLDVVEDPAETLGPALAWEYWDGFAWRLLSVDDETRNLRVPGIASFIAADDSQPLARFGMSLHWVRARLKEDGPPGEPSVRGIFPNAVWASQVRTLTDVPLGASTGLPNQVLVITQVPVLADEIVEVRELAGPRANAEWRILVLELTGGTRTAIDTLETQLGQEGPQTDFTYRELRLRRDRNKRVTEVWVRWQEQPNFFFSEPSDRHYVVDRIRGRLMFGDGTNGRIPAPGAAVLARRLRVGGGTAGNVAIRKISQLLAAVAGVESVFNPRAAEGGANSETLERFSDRGPRSVKHRGRAVGLSDYETLAREASAAVAVARALPARTPAGRPLPGWVTVIIIPYSKEARPWPSFELRREVETFIAERAPADVAASQRIYVTGPEYLAVSIAATIAPVDPDQGGAVEKRSREALLEFLHPLSGGPWGRGWAAGRDVYLSDIAAVLERVEGVDYVEELSLLNGSVPQGESLAVPPQQVVVAGRIELRLKPAERGR